MNAIKREDFLQAYNALSDHINGIIGQEAPESGISASRLRQAVEQWLAGRPEDREILGAYCVKMRMDGEDYTTLRGEVVEDHQGGYLAGLLSLE